MSVSATIINPEDDKERLLNIPIASEAFFQDYWLPLIKKMDLNWLNCFQSGIEVSYEDKDDIIEELGKLRLYLSHQIVTNDNNTFMIKRLDNLINEIIRIFDGRKDTILYIG